MGIKLVSLEVKNYRSIFDIREGGRKVASGGIKLDLGSGMNVLVGPNNVGKSNIFRALALALGEEHGDGFAETRDSPSPLQWAVPSITLEFRVEGRRNSPEQTLLRYAEDYERSVEGISGPTFAERGIVRLRIKYQAGVRQEFIAAPAGDRTGDADLNQKALTQLRWCVRFVFVRSGESLTTFLAGQFREVLHNVLRDAFTPELQAAETLRNDYVAGLRAKLLEALQAHLTVELGGIVPEVSGVQLTPEVPDINTTISTADISVQDSALTGIGDKGTGLRGGLLVAMLRYLTEHSRRSLIFAVEEPESFLHPQAQLELRRDLEEIAERPDATLLITTHSPFVISDASGAQVFRLGKRLDGGTTLLASSPGDDERVHAISGLFGSELIPRMLAEVQALRDDCRGIIVVEGGTDETYLRRAVHAASRPELLQGVHILAAGGAEQAFIQAAQWRSRGGPPVFVLLDADAHGRSAAERLRSSGIGFDGRDVLTYSKVIGGSGEDTEAEDLLPEAFIRAFVDAHGGEEVVLSEKIRRGSGWHLGIKSDYKEAFAAYVERHASADDLAHFLKAVELADARFAAAKRRGTTGRPGQ